MAKYSSKHTTVSRAPYELYMSFVDMRNFVRYLPEDRREEVRADYDSLKATVQGLDIGVRVTERTPYSRITLEDDGMPFRFVVRLEFEAEPGEEHRTDFHIEVEAGLNFMMRMTLGSKIQEALDRIADGLAAVSEGRLPEGVDPSLFPGGFR